QLPFYRKPSRQCLLELIARSDCLGLNTQQGKTGAKKPQPANRPNNWSAIKKNEQLRMILEKESVLVPKIEGWRHSTSLCRFCLASRSRKRALGSRWVYLLSLGREIIANSPPSLPRKPWHQPLRYQTLLPRMPARAGSPVFHRCSC